MLMPSKKELDAEFKSNLQNQVYSTAIENWLLCTGVYMSEITIPMILERQLERRDIDTVCAYELVQMKKLFLQTDILEYSRFLEKPTN